MTAPAPARSGLVRRGLAKAGRVAARCSASAAGLTASRGALGLLVKAAFADGGTKRGAVQCRFPAVSEASEAFYRDLLAAADTVPHVEAVPGRVLLVSSTLGPGGAERQIANTIMGLRARGVDASYLGFNLAAAPLNAFYLECIEAAGVPATDLDRSIAPERDGVFGYDGAVARLLSALRPDLLRVVLPLAEQLRGSRPSVVHAWLDETNIVTGIAAALAGIPRIVLSCRSVAPDNFPFHQPYMRPAYRALDAFPGVVLLNNSAAGARDYARWMGVAPERFTVVRNGFDFAAHPRSDPAAAAAFRSDTGLPEGAPVMGLVSRLGPEKRPFLWLDVARRVAQAVPGTHFLVVGDGPLRQQMLDYATRIGIAERLHMPGVRADVSAALACMDVFLLTSENEGLPNVLIEAQHHGVPVVGTAVGGVPEAFADRETGLLCPADDAEGMAAAVIGLLTDPSRRDRMGRAGTKLVAERFGLGRMLDETLAAYGMSQSGDAAESSRR